MTIRDIDAFLAIYQYGSMAEASRRLYITQPTLSRRIQALENELGYQLLVRGKGHQSVELTAKGEQFIHLAYNWKYVWEDMVNLPPDTTEVSYRLHFSAVNSLVTHIIYPAVYSFLKLHPNIRINLESQHSYNAFARVRSGILDGAFVMNTFYNNSILAHQLWTEPMVLVYGPSVQIVKIQAPSDLDIATELRVQWNQEFLDWHNYWFSDKKQYKLEVDQIPPVEHMLADNPELWMIAPITIAMDLSKHHYINYKSLEALPSRRVYYITKDERLSSAMRFFFQHLYAILQSTPNISVTNWDEWLSKG